MQAQPPWRCPTERPQYFSMPNYANSPLPGNIVTEWNAIAQDFLQPTPMPGMPMPMGGVSMSTAFVYLSYVQAAVYNALVGIEGGYDAYDVDTGNQNLPPCLMSGNRGCERYASQYHCQESRAGTQPHRFPRSRGGNRCVKVLTHYFPADTTLLPKYTDSLAAIPDGPAKTAGIAIGEQAAADIIALRTGDGLLAPSSYTVPAPARAFGSQPCCQTAPSSRPWIPGWPS